MKDKKECKIIQDLLPNYIEKLTNEETNQYIEKHIEECEECRKALENMQKDIKMSDEKRDDREVKYIKKFSTKMRTLKLILLAIIVLFVLLIGRRMIIMLSLSEKAQQKSNNYYAKLYSYQGDSLTVTESYNLGEDYLTIMNKYSNDGPNRKLIWYQKGGEKIFLSEYDGKKYILDSEGMMGGKIIPVTYVEKGFLFNLYYALFVGVDSTYCNGKQCYSIKGDNYERYIDKETGLAIRSIDKSDKAITRQTDTIVDYEYKLNSVQETDIKRPNTTGYIKSEQ